MSKSRARRFADIISGAEQVPTEALSYVDSSISTLNTTIDNVVNTELAAISHDGFLLAKENTTAPTNPVKGQLYTNNIGVLHIFNGSTWDIVGKQFIKRELGCCVIGGGGGGGGRYYSGGGGAGGALRGYFDFEVGETYTVTVGGGGAGAGAGAAGGQGGDSSIVGAEINLFGFGGGAGVPGQGRDGGSGGGGGRSYPISYGVEGQGNNSGGNPSYGGQGGGGAGEAGGTTGYSDGGDGLTFTEFTNNNGVYAGGGGGAMDANIAYYVSAGGSGGGGNGGADYLGTARNPVAGVQNTGGGGGGACWNNTPNGAAGGSGVVFVKIPTEHFSGIHTASSVSTDATHTYLTFTDSGTFVA